MPHLLRAFVAIALLAGIGGCAGGGAAVSVDALLGRFAGGDGTTVAGLREALTVATRNAVDRTARLDGFLGDERIRIRLPESLQPMANGLRAVGLGGWVDELEVAMNRAAERAAGEAGDVFWDAIRRMSFADAQSILAGGDTAATDYFEKTTREPLRVRFEPIVAEKMDEVGAVRLYRDVSARYAALPFAKKPTLDIRSYVTGKALDGLFAFLAEEERRIRTDPAARVTPLLRQVFGS